MTPTEQTQRKCYSVDEETFNCKSLDNNDLEVGATYWEQMLLKSAMPTTSMYIASSKSWTRSCVTRLVRLPTPITAMCLKRPKTNWLR